MEGDWQSSVTLGNLFSAGVNVANPDIAVIGTTFSVEAQSPHMTFTGAFEFMPTPNLSRIGQNGSCNL